MKEIRLRIFGEAVIEVGDTKVTPTSSHIFALLLLLTLGPKEGWTRRELMELLLGGVEAKDASHRLRQLLYKLRGMGVELAEEREGLGVRAANSITSADFDEQTLCSAPSTVVLAKYDPALPPPFHEWLESKRDETSAQVRDSITKLLQKAKQSGDWQLTARVAERLRELDPYSGEAICVGAEALALTGRRNQALRLLDDLCADDARDAALLADARRLRARIGKTDSSQTQTPLVGREEVLAFVGRSWESTMRSGPHLYTVIGAPGMGKTRIAASISNQIQVTGGRAIQFSCNPDMQESPYSFFSYALTRLFAQPGSIGIDPEYRSALETLSSRPQNDHPIGDRSAASKRRTHLQQALIDLLDCVSTDRPLALIIDDTQWMDDASRRAFDVLCHSSPQVRVLVVLLRRPMPIGSLVVPSTSRVATYVLPPLTAEQSRTLLRSIQDNVSADVPATEWIIAQSAGNPFYLCTLSRAADAGLNHKLAPIQSIASSTYYALDGDSRSLLDACLLLDSYASLSRIEAITGMQTEVLLRCLRALEDAAIVSFDGGVIQGPHAILQDALRSLIPRSVAALLHRSISRRLADEVAITFDPALAMAAVRSLLAADAPDDALELARSCARRASLLGEPGASTNLLNELAQYALPPASRRVLLDELVAYAEAAGLRDISSRALDDRLTLALSLRESRSVVTDIRLRSMSGAFRGPRAVPSVPPLQEIAEDSSLPGALRNRAACRILTVAFLHNDVALAERTHTNVVRGPSNDEEPNVRRAGLIYHTVFGDSHEAKRLVTQLLSDFSTTSADYNYRDVQCNAAFALMHMGLRHEGALVACAHYEAMQRLGMMREMEYSAGLMVEMMIAVGDYQGARLWTEREREAAVRHAGSAATYSACYYSSIAMLALHDGDPNLTLKTMSDFKATYAASSTPRFRTITLGLEVRALLARGDCIEPAMLDQLESLYEEGKRFGGHDATVQALCLAYRATGRDADARLLVNSYTGSWRRELGPLETGLIAACDGL